MVKKCVVFMAIVSLMLCPIEATASITVVTPTLSFGKNGAIA